METISVIIADDEKIARKRVRDLLFREPGVRLLGECSTGVEVIQEVQRVTPDLLFLDIQMPAPDGFAVLDAIPLEQRPLVVFVTAYDNFALRAFSVHAFDYLLKPFDRDRFRDTLQRARAQISQSRKVSATPATAPPLLSRERLAIRNKGHVTFVKLESVDWIEAADNYVCLHCGATTHIMRETLSTLELRLDPRRFLRIHRSTIVNVDRIQEIQPWFRGDSRVVLAGGTTVTLSRNYRERLDAVLLDTQRV